MPKSKKLRSVNYTSRDFDTIKEDLVEYAKKYYPDTYKDFNQASFGSLMLDTVSYVGDILSFYLDYQANETFLDTSIEYDNILRIGRQVGYKLESNQVSSGVAAFYVLVPSNSDGSGPDYQYAPILSRGTTLEANNGIPFTLNTDVDFSDLQRTEVKVARANIDTGIPTYFAIKSYGEIISGFVEEEEVELGNFQKFLKVELETSNISEIISVTDSEGNEYYEVPNLSQDMIYKGIRNKSTDAGEPLEVIKPIHAIRRFVFDRDTTGGYLYFGASSNVAVEKDFLADPSLAVLDVQGKNYITDTFFEPLNLIQSDKFGLAPSNTELTVRVRTNPGISANVSAGDITTVINPVFRFKNYSNLDSAKMSTVRNSLNVRNEEGTTGATEYPSEDEIRTRVMDTFSSQNRAVTEQDYVSLIYRMPSKFGSIKRTKIIRDDDSLRRNLNVYVVSEDSDGNLTKTNSTVKRNLRTWLTGNKMLNDTIDIIDAKVVNFGVSFEAIGNREKDFYDILTEAEERVRDLFSKKMDIGEYIFLTDIYAELKKTEGLLDVTKLKIVRKIGGNYSDTYFDFQSSMTEDNRALKVPKNVVMEIKDLVSDINGKII